MPDLVMGIYVKVNIKNFHYLESESSHAINKY